MSTPRRTRKAVDRPRVAVLYLRVSTGQQAESGLSLEQQERTLRQAALAHGFDDVIVLREEGVSGRSLRKRPALAQALDLLATGQAAALVVSKLDRLSRSTRDTLQLCDAADRQGWRLISLDLGLDTATPTGRLVLTMLAAVAEMEHSRIAERHRDWHAAKRQRGLVWGVDEGPRPEIPLEVRDRILRERQAGDSLRVIAERLKTEDVPTARGGRWYASTIAAVVNSPAAATSAV